MATTPRPLVWKNSTPISTGVENPVKSIQFEDGNADIIYQKDKKIKHKDATITQGHWDDMSLGNELQSLDYDANVKDSDIAHGTIDNLYELFITSANRPLLIYKKYMNGAVVENRQYISYIV